MLKFNPEVFGLHGVFPPLAGVRGRNFEQLSFFHPPPPASGGEHPANLEKLCKNLPDKREQAGFNIWKFAKTELNSPVLWRGLGEEF